ncbi:MAG: hypothetical protein H6642_12815 [Caldilineaceae bacterium]|nr:hypothetical protein [Caldilineaceae bacterium]
MNRPRIFFSLTKRTLISRVLLSAALLLLIGLLGACGRAAPPPDAVATPLPTPEPERYVSATGGFSFPLPDGWTATADSEPGVLLLLPPQEETQADSDDIFHVFAAVQDPAAVLSLLCADCLPSPLTSIAVNGRPAWTFSLTGDDGAPREWTVVENGDVLVAYTLSDAEIVAGLRFTPVIDGEARAAAMADAMRTAVANLSGDDAAVTIRTVEAVTWSDACLDAPLIDELCAQSVTPGYRVVIDAPEGEYRFHFDPVTTQIRLAAGPEVDVGDVLVEWRSLGSPCETVRIGRAGVALGACGAHVLLGGPPPDAARTSLLTSLLDELAFFEAETPAGFVTFFGRGTRTATPAEQRQLAELARLMHTESTGGTADVPALTWQRRGAGGYCDELTILRSGETWARTCRGATGDETAVGVLDLEALVQLYTWVDLLGSGSAEWVGPDVDDPLRIEIAFSGDGEQMPDREDAAAMLPLAAAVFTDLFVVDDRLVPVQAPPVACPQPAADETALVLPELGFCLLYPEAYNFYRPAPDQVILAVDSLFGVREPRVTLFATPADQAPPPAAADEDGAAEPLVVAGRDARLWTDEASFPPGRTLLLETDSRRYRFLFALALEEGGRENMDALFDLLTGSLTLLDDAAP